MNEKRKLVIFVKTVVDTESSIIDNDDGEKIYTCKGVFTQNRTLTNGVKQTRELRHTAVGKIAELEAILEVLNALYGFGETDEGWQTLL